MVEDRLFLHIEMDARQEFRQIAAHELADGLIFDFRIDPEVLHVLREVVRTVRKTRSRSLCRRAGAFSRRFFSKISSHDACKNSTSDRSSSSDTPSLTVHTI